MIGEEPNKVIILDIAIVWNHKEDNGWIIKFILTILLTPWSSDFLRDLGGSNMRSLLDESVT